MYESPEIAIVGGGPAGLTAAVILCKRGHNVRVYEADISPSHRTQGGTLDLHADAGQLALERAGLLDAFRAVARHEDQNTKNLDPLTGLVAEVPPHPGEEMDRPEIDRGILRELLLAALPSDVVIWNSKLESVQMDAGGRHHLILHDGAVVAADIIVGADGAWSRVRNALTTIRPSYTGVTFMEGWIENPTRAQANLVGEGSMFAFGGPEAIFAQKNGAGRICVYAAARRPEAWLRKQLEQLSPLTAVQGLYQGWADNFLDLIDGCETFTERPIYSLPADFSWTSVPGITLIGDAAHVMPPLGVGVNLAMLDASDVAIAIAQERDWRDGIQQSEIAIRNRAQGYMRDIIPQFEEWFSGPSVAQFL
jgi:2-polyprenyl-6-methoxyphenol hydroxylase-like FAD-dependent oxidoreductase